MTEENKTKEEVKIPELTPEQKKAQVEREARRLESLAKKQKTLIELRRGAAFMKFIYDDIKGQASEEMDRAQRRRFSKELRKGIFSPELVEVYTYRLDEVLAYIEKELNPTPEKEKVDGAKLYENLKKDEKNQNENLQ